MSCPNVLITSAAAKVMLVKAFAEAVHALGGKVYTADLPDVPCAAKWFSDGHVALPPTHDEPAFVQALHATCEQLGITLVVPTRDAELPLMADIRDDFLQTLGVQIHVSRPWTIATCLDKKRFVEFCQTRNIPVLPLVDPQHAADHLPLFARPRSAAGGRGARRIMDEVHLQQALKEECILQPCVDAPEYSIDMLRTLDGNKTLGLAIRKRENVRCGEAQYGMLVQHDALAEVACKLAAALQLCGHCNLQFFDCSRRGILAIEVNPRFGGASNLAIRAGLDSPARILQMHQHPQQEIPPVTVQTGWQMLRYGNDIILDEKGKRR